MTVFSINQSSPSTIMTNRCGSAGVAHLGAVIVVKMMKMDINARSRIKSKST